MVWHLLKRLGKKLRLADTSAWLEAGCQQAFEKGLQRWAHVLVLALRAAPLGPVCPHLVLGSNTVVIVTCKTFDGHRSNNVVLHVLLSPSCKS